MWSIQQRIVLTTTEGFPKRYQCTHNTGSLSVPEILLFYWHLIHGINTRIILSNNTWPKVVHRIARVQVYKTPHILNPTHSTFQKVERLGLYIRKCLSLCCWRFTSATLCRFLRFLKQNDIWRYNECTTVSKVNLMHSICTGYTTKLSLFLP